MLGRVEKDMKSSFQAIDTSQVSGNENNLWGAQLVLC